MHSRVFQISTTQIDKENYLNEDTLNQGDNSFYDYCADISDEERKEEITNLVNSILPKGMFELVSEDTIRYTGDGMEQWKEKYVAEIRKKADAITVENMFEWSSTYYLKQAIDNPLDTGYHFYLNGDGCQSFAEPSFEFMLFEGMNPARFSTSEASLIITSDGICRIATRYHAGGFTQLI